MVARMVDGALAVPAECDAHVSTKAGSVAVSVSARAKIFPRDMAGQDADTNNFLGVNCVDGMVPLDKWFGSFHHGKPEADATLQARQQRCVVCETQPHTSKGQTKWNNGKLVKPG